MKVSYNDISDFITHEDPSIDTQHCCSRCTVYAASRGAAVNARYRLHDLV